MTVRLRSLERTDPCHGKHPYRSRRHANNAAGIASRIATDTYGERHIITAYKCPRCRRWHIGHQPGANHHTALSVLRGANRTGIRQP